VYLAAAALATTRRRVDIRIAAESPNCPNRRSARGIELYLKQRKDIELARVSIKESKIYRDRVVSRGTFQYVALVICRVIASNKSERAR